METIRNLPNSIASIFRTRFLHDWEKTILGKDKELPLVIEPIKAKTFNALTDLVRKNSEWLNQQRNIYGAILFRGFEVKTGEQFQNILELLNIDLASYYHFGSAQRVKITDKVFTSSEAPGNVIISPHNELNMVPTRPGVISFFCQVQPDLYGETPIVNTEKVFNQLSTKLQQKFSSFPQKYVRFVPSHLLSTVFENLCKQEIDTLLQKEGFKFNWQSDGSLYYECSYIPLVKHPVTGKLCFFLSTMDSLVTREWYRKISQRYSFAKNIYHHYFPANLYKMLEQRNIDAATVLDNSTNQTSILQMYLVDGEGNDTKMTVAEAQELGKVELDNAVIFKWKQGDILVMDNLQVAHSRLNVQQPRKILTAFGNMCSIWDMEQILVS